MADETTRELHSMVDRAPAEQRPTLLAQLRTWLGVPQAPPAVPSPTSVPPATAAAQANASTEAATQASAPAVDEEKEQLRARVAELERAAREQPAAPDPVRAATDAGDAFYMELFAENKIEPGQRDRLVEAYARAVLDDARDPAEERRADGSKPRTRVATLRELYGAQPALVTVQQFTTEQIQGARVLATSEPAPGGDTSPKAQPSPAESNVVKLLSYTESGRKALEEQQKRGVS